MDDIINLFTKEHGIYKQILKFNTILFFIFILILVVKFDFFNGKSIFILIAFILTIYMTNIFVKVSQNDLNDTNKIIYFKLQSLQSKIYEYVQKKINSKNSQEQYKKEIFSVAKLDSLYIDANMIEFFYSIIKLYEYNPDEFYLLIKGTNNILKLRIQIETFYEAESDYPENIHETLQIALNLKINCINNLQNFIYSVPKITKMYTFIDNIIETYTVLINKNISIIYNYHLDYIKKHGINNNTLFIDIHSTKAFDSLSNHSIIPGKNQNKLVDLYV